MAVFQDAFKNGVDVIDLDVWLKEYEYEVKYRDGSEGFAGLKLLIRRGWEKAVNAIDARIAQRSGLYIRVIHHNVALNH